MRNTSKFILRATVNGKTFYLAKQGTMVTEGRKATRFTRAEVRQIADMMVTDTPFIVTPVTR
jgi:Mor family transcriptional regulator